MKDIYSSPEVSPNSSVLDAVAEELGVALYRQEDLDPDNVYLITGAAPDTSQPVCIFNKAQSLELHRNSEGEVIEVMVPTLEAGDFASAVDMLASKGRFEPSTRFVVIRTIISSAQGRNEQTRRITDKSELPQKEADELLYKLKNYKFISRPREY